MPMVWLWKFKWSPREVITISLWCILMVPKILGNFLTEGVKSKVTGFQVQAPLNILFSGSTATCYHAGPSVKPTMLPTMWLNGLVKNTFLPSMLQSTTIWDCAPSHSTCARHFQPSLLCGGESAPRMLMFLKFSTNTKCSCWNIKWMDPMLDTLWLLVVAEAWYSGCSGRGTCRGQTF